MQTLLHKKLLSLTVAFGLLTSFGNSAGATTTLQSKPISEVINFPSISDLSKKQVAAGALVLVGLAAIWCYRHKSTQPKRVYPKDNSASEILSYIWDEIIVGQEEKPERASTVEMDLENPTVLHIKYDKVDPRGIIGITHAYTKDVIIPTLTALVLFKAYKKQIIEGLVELVKFINNPETIAHVVQEVVQESPK